MGSRAACDGNARLKMVDMLIDDTPQLIAWRQEVRGFLDAELPGGMHFDFDFDEDPDRWALYRAFWRKVGERKWISLTWPTEYYGLGRSVQERYILQEEFCNHGVPAHPVIGLPVADAILRLGTPEQRRRHLKGIAEASVVWGEGYTEPGAGSDLASLTTRADRDGDYWVINGEKTLGTAAHWCEWMFVLARTDPNSKKHAGISAFAVPLNLPGISMAPLRNMADGQQNVTFFDNVRIPADGLIGDEGQAWNQVWFSQGGEQLDPPGPAPDPWLYRLQRMVALIRRFVRETRRGGRLLWDDPVVRLQLAELEMGVEILRMHTRENYSNVVTGRMRSGSPILVAHLQQAWYKEQWPRMAQLAMEVVGPMSQLQGGPGAVLHGKIEQAFRASFGNHAGGTSQLKRMVLATRGLGMPR